MLNPVSNKASGMDRSSGHQPTRALSAPNAQMAKSLATTGSGQNAVENTEAHVELERWGG